MHEPVLNDDTAMLTAMLDLMLIRGASDNELAREIRNALEDALNGDGGPASQLAGYIREWSQTQIH